MIEECSFSGELDNSARWAGGICGVNGGTISKCYTEGLVNITVVEKIVWGSPIVGGICGYNSGGKIISSLNRADIKMASKYGDPRVGGVCASSNTGEISYCYNRGNLILNFDNEGDGSAFQLGGILGITENETKISHCYTTGNLSVIRTDESRRI